MFHNTIVKHAAVKFLSIMMYQIANAANVMLTTATANMFQNTTGNMFVAKTTTHAALQLTMLAAQQQHSN